MVLESPVHSLQTLPGSHYVLPLLKKCLDPDKFVRLRREAAIAIRKIDPEEYKRLCLPGTLVLP
jgi:hypothetical protein